MHRTKEKLNNKNQKHTEFHCGCNSRRAKLFNEPQTMSHENVQHNEPILQRNKVGNAGQKV